MRRTVCRAQTAENKELANRLAALLAPSAWVTDNDDDVVVLGGDFNTLFGRLEGVESELARQGFSNSLAGERRLLPRLDHFYADAKIPEIRGLRALLSTAAASAG